MKEKISITLKNEILKEVDKLAQETNNRSIVIEELIRDGLLHRQRSNNGLEYDELKKIISRSVEAEAEKQGNRILIMFKKALTEISSTFLLLQMLFIKKEKIVNKSEYKELMKNLEEKSLKYLQKQNENETVSEIINEITIRELNSINKLI